MATTAPEPTGHEETLVDPPTRRLIARVILTAPRGRSVGLAGAHRTRRLGSSLDVADHRPYQPGDDLRHLDMAALARLDAPWVRLFDAEASLPVHLLVDTSASMDAAGPDGVSCRWKALQVAAMFGIVGLGRGDPVQLGAFDADEPSPRWRGGACEAALVRSLMALPVGGELQRVGVLRALARAASAGVAVVASDLLDPDWPRWLAGSHWRGGLTLVRVRASDELDMSLDGVVELVDRESGQVLSVELTASARRRHAALLAEHDAQVDLVAARVGATVIELPTSAAVVDVLTAHWRRQGWLR